MANAAPSVRPSATLGRHDNMTTKESKEVLRALNRLGFEYLWTNGHGIPCYVHPDDPSQTEVLVNLSQNKESSARAKIRDLQKIAGELPQLAKRKGQQVKERRAAEREQAERRLAWAEAKKARLLEQPEADTGHLSRLDELIEHRRQQLLAIHHQMTESPAGAAHRGRGYVELRGTATDRTPL